ncbi:glycosyltransferase [Citrifermentans bremense]|uniref:glycosyltransferase n=1 Tax=Citrifermentans bremense TaxID=60035 RepID=UPI00040FF28A|nr:glycosyltransferase [Citrifermentans bremense]
MKLSVLMITYNHAPFIAQALESVLMQQVGFDYEIVVGEDCSTDETRDILMEYQERHPDRIRLLLPEKNLGMIRNFAATCKECRGEYVAILEGDDFWTSRNKLQRQVDFLDANPECAACFHNVEVVYGDGREPHLFHRKPLKMLFDQRDIASDFFIPTCSTVFRNGLFGDFPKWFYDLPMGDWPLHVLNAEHGLYAYLDEILASYRVHQGGVWSQRKTHDNMRQTVLAMTVVNRELGFRHGKSMGRKIAMLEYELAYAMAESGDAKGALKQVARALEAAPLYLKLYRRVLTKLLWKTVIRGGAHGGNLRTGNEGNGKP